MIKRAYLATMGCLGWGLLMGGVQANTLLDTLLSEGQTALNKGAYIEAAQHFRKVLQINGDHVLAKQGLQEALRQETLAEPHREQTEVIKAVYLSETAQTSLSWLSGQQFSLQELNNVVLQNNEDHHFRPQALLTLAQLQAGDTRLAMQTAIRLKKQYPDHPSSWNLWGLACDARSDSMKAKNAYERALSLKSDFHAARLNLATIFMKAGDFSGAETEIRRVLSATQGQDRQALLSMAKLKKLQGNPSEAEIWYARVSEIL